MKCDSPGLGQEPTSDRLSALSPPVLGVTQYHFCLWSRTLQTQHLNESQTCVLRESMWNVDHSVSLWWEC